MELVAAKPGTPMPSYQEELAASQLQAIRTACLLAAPLVLVFSLLDRAMVPHDWVPLLVVRAIASLVLLGCARAACREVGLDDAPKSKPTNTEAGIFHRAGAQAIVFGPGRSTGNAHCANEHNLYSQMKKAIEFYRALIARLCQ